MSDQKTLNGCGDVSKACISYGQLFKALSRATTQENIFIKINKNINQGQILKHSNRLYTSTIFLKKFFTKYIINLL